MHAVTGRGGEHAPAAAAAEAAEAEEAGTEVAAVMS
jgi:hypothetical protein